MSKKSILFVVDLPNWAYHNIVKELNGRLSEKYELYLVINKDFLLRKNNSSTLKRLVLNLKSRLKFLAYKILGIDKKIYFYYEGYAVPTKTHPKVSSVDLKQQFKKTNFDFIVDMAYYFQYVSKLPFRAEKKIVGLYTDSFPHEGPTYDLYRNIDLTRLSREEFFEGYLKSYDGLIVGSQNLYDDYSRFGKKMALVNSTYKAKEFRENKNIGNREGLTIGWTGNPNREMKGFREIIEPVVNELKAEGYHLELKTKFEGPYEDLLTFYEDVDLVCIASSADTGPSLFAEASLCSVPSVSTKIGFPKMVIQDGINGIFIERDKQQLKEAIKRLYNDRELLKSFSMRIKKDYLQTMDNEKLAANFINLLKDLS